MGVVAGGRAARTLWWVRESFDGVALVECRLVTGRTHQVRVHMAAIGHPVVGDRRYAGPAGARSAGGEPTPRMFLHAARLSIDHPGGGRMTWESPLPADLVAVLEARSG